jgi:hypothetical protein
MNRVIALCILFFGSLGVASAQDPGWPRQITKLQGTVVHYQPRFDRWNFSQLDWGMAVSLTPAGGTATVGLVLSSTHNYQQQRSSAGRGGGEGGGGRSR